MKPEASLPPTPVAPPSTPQGSLAQAPPTPEGSLAQSQASDAVAAVQSNAIVALGGRAAAWQRCKRIYADPDAPPLLKQKWEEATSKKMKTDLFMTFVSCGGNAGRMLCAEQKKWRETIEDEDEACWLTRDDLLQKYHGRVEKVDALIATKTAQRKSRPHNDFPKDPDMTQYYVWDKSVGRTTTSSQSEKNLNWTARLQGDTAIEVAQSANQLLDIQRATPPSSAGKGGRAGAGKRLWRGEKALRRSQELRPKR